MTTAAAALPPPPDTREQAGRLYNDLMRLQATTMRTALGRWNGEGVPGWVGESTDAHMDSIRHLDTKLTEVINAMGQVKEQVLSWIEELRIVIEVDLPRLHKNWEAVNDWRTNELQRVQNAVDSGEYDPLFGALRGQGIENEATEQQQDLKRKYQDLLEALDQEALVLARNVAAARDLFLPPDTGHTREEIATNLFDDNSILEGQQKWEQAKRRAPEIAEHLANGLEDIEGDTKEEKALNFLAKYGPDLEDPYTATAVSTHVPPDQVVKQTMEALDSVTDPTVTRTYLAKIGTFMTLASGGVSVSPDRQADQEQFLLVAPALAQEGRSVAALHQNYAQAMTEALEEDFSLPQNPGLTIRGATVIPQILGQAALTDPDLAASPTLLQAQGAHGSFLERIVQHDARMMSKVDGNLVPWGHGFHPSLNDGPDDPVHSVLTLMDRPESLGAESPERLLENDQLRAAAAKNFLASDIVLHDTNGDGKLDDDDATINVTRHLMGGRTVNDSGSPYLSTTWQSYSGFPDGGEVMGELVAEASLPESLGSGRPTTPHEDKDWWEREKAGAKIAENFLLGYQDGLDRYEPPGGPDDGQRAYGRENPHLRSWADEILGPRLKGIGKSMSGNVDGHAEDHDPTSNRYLITLTSDEALRLLGPGGVFMDLAFEGASQYEDSLTSPSEGKRVDLENPSTVDNLLLWASKGYDEDVRTVLDLPKGPQQNPTSGVQKESEHWAPIFETLFTAPEGASAQAIQAVSDRNAAWQNSAHQLADVSVSLAGTGKNPLTGPAAEIVKTMVLDPIIEDSHPTGYSAADDFVSKQQLTVHYMSSILANAALEKIDFSEAPTLPEAAQDLELPKELFQDGRFTSLDKMEGQDRINARQALHDYLYGQLGDWEFDDARTAMKLEALANDADQRGTRLRTELRNRTPLGRDE
ncbi:hypothetical protein EII34_15520 [Arachnia propionica]|uniref:Uncharacterized protein n=1 Tax=Arachnia propionica TaxID=1750 RepID=A0A3P1T3M6_9ACTN|nr:hypothetical protein [Arachnia propionica]RRD03093.1 hypothetical protein EII34_15520 [Arachnia propionica]